jgi:hypothetical protein
MTISRRKFLKKTNHSALAAALISSSLGWARPVFAAGEAPKKLILFYVPNGFPSNESWFPTSANLSSLPPASAPLQSVSQHCLFFKGAFNTIPGDGHTQGPFGVFGGAQKYNRPTLGVVVANHFAGASIFSELNLGIMASRDKTISSPGTERECLEFENNPITAFNRLFSSVDDVGAKRKKSVLDASLNQLNNLKTRLNGFAMQRLDEHMTAIREVEMRISTRSAAACEVGNWNPENYGSQSIANSVYQSLELQIDLAVLAFKCNLTQVVAIQIGDSGGCSPFSCFTSSEIGITAGYHNEVVHNPDKYPGQHLKGRAHFSKKLADLISALASINDVDGSKLLDNTLIVQSSEMGAHTHHIDNIPLVVAGGRNFGVRTGRLLTLPDNTKDSKILNSVAQLMGVDADSPSFPSYDDNKEMISLS